MMMMMRMRMLMLLLLLELLSTKVTVVNAWVVQRQQQLHPRNLDLSLLRSEQYSAGSSSSRHAASSPTRKRKVCLFMSSTPTSNDSSSSSSSSRRRSNSEFFNDNASSDDFLDVEFERVANNDDGEEDDTNTPISVYSSLSDDGIDIGGLLKKKNTKKTLIDLSFETAAEEAAEAAAAAAAGSRSRSKDTGFASTSSSSSSIDWQNIRVPFTRGDEYIDCKVAFTVEYENETYGIGVVYDTPVAIVVEEQLKTTMDKKQQKQQRPAAAGEEDCREHKTKVTLVDPDQYTTNDDYAELMELFAKQLQEQFGDQFYLRKTPKVLTISGGIDQVTKHWEQDLMPMKPYTTESLLDAVPGLLDGLETSSSSEKKTKTKAKNDNTADCDTAADPDLQEFYDFMRKELGDEEFEETMNKDEFTKEEMDLLKYMDIPGVGVGGGGEGEGSNNMEELINSIMVDLDEMEAKESTTSAGVGIGGGGGGGVIEEAQKFATVDTANSKALKLFGYEFRETGEKYTLVQFLQPFTLVGRLCKNNHPITNTAHAESESSQDDEDAAGDGTGIEFDLLTPEEEKVLIPKLEQLCRQDLAEKGLTFQED